MEEFKKDDLVVTTLDLLFYQITIKGFGKTIIENFGGQTKKECFELAKIVYPGFLVYKMGKLASKLYASK